MVVFWFRRDLRLDDNTGLNAALATGKPVLPIFIFDKNILDELPENDARVQFISENLAKINQLLQKYNSSLAVFHDTPEAVFSKLATTLPIETVFTNEDEEPYALQRDQAVALNLKSLGIGFKKFKDQVIFSAKEILKDDGKPYVVYTPYAKKWLYLFENKLPKVSELRQNPHFALHNFPFLSLADIGFKQAAIKVPDFTISKILLTQYPDTRNYPELATSKIGPHLRFGTISIRKLALLSHQSGAKTYLGELIWREFFMQILSHFPHTAVRSFKPEYDHIPWKNNPEHFKKWQTGHTGIPIVDAGMRELNATGFMHNRVRMITASFLCKNLLIDWRWGEAYFALKLLDYEMSSNIGNWQWAAGSGVDAAPYFRVFNPQTQAEKFDPNLNYINKWVPELQTFNYPPPIVDLKQSRELAITTYKKALSA